MFDIKKLFVREARARKKGRRLEPDSEYNPSSHPGDGLEVEYQAIIATQFRRWGISGDSVTVEVRKIGQAPGGFDILVGMVRIEAWDRTSALRVLIGLPLLEARVRKLVRATWLADYSHFGGLWLHAAEQLQTGASAAELRELLLQLVPPSSVSTTGASHTSEAASTFSPLSTGPIPSLNSTTSHLPTAARISG